ncbi:MAG TPA: tetratricopeptide repeat protein [Bdellovibrionota bacterium]|nr:tetratricopeptide repeat protein [Bdellovibrionota bacterium]
MLIFCPRCQTHFDIEVSMLPASKVKLRCSSCDEIFPFEVAAAPDEIIGQALGDHEVPFGGGQTTEDGVPAEIEPEIIPIDEVSKERRITQRRRRRQDRRSFGLPRGYWGVVAIGALVLGGAAYWVTRETPDFDRLRTMEQAALPRALNTPGPTPIPLTVFGSNAPAPTWVAPPAIPTGSSTALSVLEAFKKVETEVRQVATPSVPISAVQPQVIARKAISAEDVSRLAAFRQELEKFRPSVFEKMRPQLVELWEKIGEQEDLALLLADVHSYLGGRQNKESWIRYGYEMSFRWSEKNPQDSRGARSLALAYNSARQFGKALPHAQEAATLRPRDPVAFAWLGIALTQGKAAEAGLMSLEGSVRQFPASFVVKEALARAYIDRKQYKKAVPLLRKLSEVEPDDLVTAEMLARGFEGEGMWAEVSLIYEPLVKRLPDRWEPRFSLGRSYRLTKRFDEARALLDGILGHPNLMLMNRERAMIHLERAKIEFDQGYPKPAIEDLKKAHEFNPSDLPTLRYLGSALFQAEQYAAAAVVYRRAMEAQPGDSLLKRQLGAALLESGNVAEAEKTLQSVRRSGEEDASLFYYLARAREAQGDRSGAIAFLESALRMDPSYKNAKIRLEKLQGR